MHAFMTHAIILITIIIDVFVGLS